MKLEISRHERSKMMVLTNESRVLRKLREEAGLSLREVGKRLGKNHTTIVHIETGRLDVPKGERLMELLRLYGLDNQRSFYDRVRNFQDKISARQELRELTERLSDDRLEIVLRVAKRIAEGKAVIAL